MKIDGRLSGVLHLLLHLAETDVPMTSERMAAAMHSNAVVARRIMAGLRDAGIVHSIKGHGGGWTLAKPPASVSLRAVYEALGAPRLFAFGHRSAQPKCLVEQAVNAALDEAMAAAEAALLARMEAVTLAALAEDFDERLAARGIDREGYSHA